MKPKLGKAIGEAVRPKYSAGLRSDNSIAILSERTLELIKVVTADEIILAFNEHAALIAIAEAADKIVRHYVANIGSENEFISCITPPHASDMTVNERKNDKTWSKFDAVRKAIANLAAVREGGGK